MPLANTLTDAVNDILEHGHDDPYRIDRHTAALRMAITEHLGLESQVQEHIRLVLEATYRNLVDKHRILQRHSGVAMFSLESARPLLRAELDRRILAASNLIKQDREFSINQMLHRFQAWSSSIPPNGIKHAPKVQIKKSLRKSIANLPYVERRLAIDQAQKLTSNLSAILADSANAIAAEWHHIKPRPNYQSRPEHLARQGTWYLVKGSWAVRADYLDRSQFAGYIEDLGEDSPGIPIQCACWFRYAHTLRDVPTHLLTVAGQAELNRMNP